MVMILPTTTNQGLSLPKYFPLYQILISILLNLLHETQKLWAHKHYWQVPKSLEKEGHN